MTIRTRLSLALLALTSLLAPSADAQNVRQLPRATAVTGVNDSALVTVSDSAGTAAAPRLRAVSTHELFKRPVGSATRPSFSFATDSTTGFYRATSGATGMSVAVNGTGYWIWQSNGTFAPRNNNTVDLGTTNDWVRRLYADRTFMNNGSAASPTYTFDDDQDLGMYRFGPDTLGFATSGTSRGYFHSGGLSVTDLTVSGTCTGCGGSTSFPLQGPNGGSGSNQVTYSFSGIPNAGMYAIPGDTLAFASDGFPALKIDYSSGTRLIGGAGDMRLYAGTGASRQLSLWVTNGSSTQTQVVNMHSSAANFQLPLGFPNGTPANPGLQVGNVSAVGIYGVSTADTIGIALNNAQNKLLRITDNASGHLKLLGGPNSMQIQAGTGASRTLTLSTTTAGGVVNNNLVLNADGSSTFGSLVSGTSASMSSTVTASKVGISGGTVGDPSFFFNGYGTVGLYAPANNRIGFTTTGALRLYIPETDVATGAGDVALCISTGKAMTQGATCGSSSSKVKTDIRSLDPAASVNAVMKLRPVRYAYKKGFYNQRAEFGLIAEEAAAVDQRLAFYAETEDKANGIAKGEAINVNDRAVLSLLISTVQAQQKKLEALCKAGITPAC